MGRLRKMQTRFVVRWQKRLQWMFLFCSDVCCSVRVWAWAVADILHNSSYSIARNNKKRRRQPKGKYYNYYYVTWLGVVFGVSVGNSSLLFYSFQFLIINQFSIKKQCAVWAQWQAKTTFGGGARNKTKDRGFLLFAKNWVLFCGDFSVRIFFSAYGMVKVNHFLHIL